MGEHQEDPLPSILGEEGPGDSGGLSSGTSDGGVGKDQCYHSSGWPGDHGPADRGVTSDTDLIRMPIFFLSCCFSPVVSEKQADTRHSLPCSVRKLQGWMKPTAGL